jgi:hypothetical protein
MEIKQGERKKGSKKEDIRTNERNGRKNNKGYKIQNQKKEQINKHKEGRIKKKEN